MTDLQKELLVFYKKLKDILDKNKIKYFAMGGTAIGALRGNGFIPWDDDIDLCIFEKDITKFKKAIEKSSFEFFPLNKKGKPVKKENTRYFYKVYDHDVDVISNGIQQSISIDFMIAQKENDWSSYQKVAYNFYWQLSLARRKSWKEFRSSESILFTLLNKIFNATFFFLGKTFIKKRIDKILLGGKRINNKGPVFFTYHFYKNEWYDLGNIRDIEFEDTFVPVADEFPNDFGRLYGDIFVLPPKGKRINKHKTILLKRGSCE